jgi:L-threonylcarbamoyladenylate synthase
MHVIEDLGGAIDMILDGGTTDIGIESTVLDMTTIPPVILRPGWITREKLSAELGRVECATSDSDLRRSPGTRHRHYSPRARVVLIERGSPEFIEKTCREHLKEGAVGFIGHTRVSIDDASFTSIRLGGRAEDYAHSIYAAFRELDAKRLGVIVVEGIKEEGEGGAVMDRIRRAASQTYTF